MQKLKIITLWGYLLSIVAPSNAALEPFKAREIIANQICKREKIELN